MRTVQQQQTVPRLFTDACEQVSTKLQQLMHCTDGMAGRAVMVQLTTASSLPGDDVVLMDALATKHAHRCLALSRSEPIDGLCT